MTNLRKKLKVLCFLTPAIMALSLSAKAQFASAIVDTGTAIPNVMLADINGNKNMLYDYLDSGYTVTIKLFLTTCSICWAFHQEGVFEDIYQKYGPDGSVAPRKILPIEIEMNPSTTSDDLNGIGKQTLGDWVTGVSYPIIDLNRGNARDVMRGFRDSGAVAVPTPTFLVICPDRKLVYSGEGAGSLTEQIVVKLMEGRCGKGKPTAIGQVIPETSVNIYPNPAQNVLNVNLEAGVATNTKFVISNMLGQIFVNEQVSLTQGIQTVALNIQDIPSGVYICMFTTEQGRIQKPFVVGR